MRREMLEQARVVMRLLHIDEYKEEQENNLVNQGLPLIIMERFILIKKIEI